MKNNIGRILLAGFVLLVIAHPAFAGLVFCGNKGQDPCTTQDLFKLIYVVVNFLIGIAGLVAVLFIVIGGMQMLLSAGDPGKIKDGKATVSNAILGLVLTFLAYLIIGYVVGLLLPGLGADPIQGLKGFLP